MKKCDCTSIDNSQAQTRRTQAKIQPECALELLKSGNDRFVKKMTLRRDLKLQAEITSSGQFPFAVVLSCLDSRVPTELIFDQGIGDVFNARIAGNFVNDDILGSIEFAYTSGVSLVLVLGHTQCGAIDAAIHNSENGPDNCEPCKHIIPMVKNLYPAVKRTNRLKDEEDNEYHNRVVRKNVELNIEKIRKKSDCLRLADKKTEILIIGGVYNIASGVVSFFEHPKSQVY
ncbi:MAG: carbonic anhydrase [Aureispira sp.]|nr:carbonic anhydrase [Aureispira sp.]